MKSLDSPHVEVVFDSPERRESTPSSSGTISNNGGGLQSGLAETKHLKERLNTAQVKVKRLQRLEAALADFFMEVMDRSDSNSAERLVESESSFVRGKRKEQFLRKAEGDPISLLNMLRTHLRLQFAKQETQQTDAERRALAENLSNLQKEQDTRDKFQQFELACDQLKEQRTTLIDQLNQYEIDRARTQRQHHTLLEKLSAHVQEERSQKQEAQLLVSKQQQEIETLKECRETLLKAAQNQKSLDGSRTPGAVTDGASTTTYLPASGAGAHLNGDFFGTPAENQTLRRALRKYEVKMARTEAANEERKREVQRLQQQLTGLRQSTQLQMYSRLEKESHNLRELSDGLKRRLSESEADLLRTKGALKEREIQVQKMRDEYARLFNAVQKQKQSTHYSPSKLARTASATQLSASQQNHSAHQLQKLPAAAGSIEAGDTGATTAPANGEHPYVVAYYRSEAARVERESEALKLQIRRMMASEQLHKQKTRVLRAEKQNLTRERDQLRADLDRDKRHSTMQSIAMSRQQSHSSTDKLARKVGFTVAQQEVQHLQERNVFLEERYRKSLQNHSKLATIGAVARLRSSLSVPSGFDAGADDSGESPELESDSETIGTAYHDDEIASHNSAILAKTRPSSAQATTVHIEDNGGSFRSLDAATLHSLQQVRRKTRVRPKSANPIKYMDGTFDGLDVPKHERVAKALEQVNGFRYRYHPAQHDGKKMLQFDSDDDSDLSNGEGDGDDNSSDETRRQQPRKSTKEKSLDDDSEPLMLTLDDHIENLLRKTRTLAMLKIANNTAGTIPSDSEDDDSDEAEDIVSDNLSVPTVASPKHGASSRMLSSLGSSSSMDGRRSSFLGTAAMKLARTLSAFLCLPRAISYVDLEAITEKLLESTPNDLFDDDEYADLIDCHVDSARDNETHTEAGEEEPIWKRRHSVRTFSYLRLGHAFEPDTNLHGDQRPIRPLTLSENPTDLEMHQRQIFMEANRFGGVSSRNMFLASSKHLLSKDDSKGSMYLGVSASGRLLGSTTNGSSMSLNLGRQTSTSTVLSTSSGSEEVSTNPFNEQEYVIWRTQVKEDYLAWLNAKVEAQKRRKSRVKKVDPNKKPRWLLLYEASKHPTQKYQPDVKA